MVEKRNLASVNSIPVLASAYSIYVKLPFDSSGHLQGLHTLKFLLLGYMSLFFAFLICSGCCGGYITESLPEILDVKPLDRAIEINWRPKTYHKMERSFIFCERIVEDPDFLGFNIYCYTDSLLYYEDADSLVLYLVNQQPYKEDTVYTIPNLTNSVRYFIHIAVVREDVGVSALSNQVSAVPNGGIKRRKYE